MFIVGVPGPCYKHILQLLDRINYKVMRMLRIIMIWYLKNRLIIAILKEKRLLIKHNSDYIFK